MPRSASRILALLRALPVAASLAFTATETNAASLIRDAEIENTIRSYAAPLFRAGGLDADVVEINLVNDPALNAFVSGGQRIFIFTGLLLAAADANQVIGVIAHETGHIIGGHLARNEDAVRQASTQAIVSMLLGAAAAVAGGGGGAAVATIAGGAQVAQRTLLQYSRVQEGAADQAAVKLLNATGQSPRGLRDFLDKLSGQEALATNRQDPYVLTHPLAHERVEFLREQSAASPYLNTPVPQPFAVSFSRMRAKLRGFIEPRRAFALYPTSDRSLYARYARSIAYHVSKDTNKAILEVESLVAEEPDDAYFHELKGQILFESGRIAESISSLQRSVDLDPGSALLLFGLARAQVAIENDPALNKAAIGHLSEALRRDHELHLAWQQLAIALGRDGQLGPSAAASAEYNIRTGRPEEAKLHAERASRLMSHRSPGWLRAQDIENAARDALAKKKKQ